MHSVEQHDVCEAVLHHNIAWQKVSLLHVCSSQGAQVLLLTSLMSCCMLFMSAFSLSSLRPRWAWALDSTARLRGRCQVDPATMTPPETCPAKLATTSGGGQVPAMRHSDVNNGRTKICQLAFNTLRLHIQVGFTKLRRLGGRQQKKPTCQGWYDPGMPGKSSYISWQVWKEAAQAWLAQRRNNTRQGVAGCCATVYCSKCYIKLRSC